MISSILNNSVQHEYNISMSKRFLFLFQAIQFSQAVQIQTIQFSQTVQIQQFSLVKQF